MWFHIAICEKPDHCEYAHQYLDSGIPVWVNESMADEESLTKPNVYNDKKPFKIGGFSILPFAVKHTVDNYAFIINHADMGNLLFAIDLVFLPFIFKDLNFIMVECNYSKQILDKSVNDGNTDRFLAKQVINGHFSLENLIDALNANDLTNVKNLVLLHLSDQRSDAELFKRRIEEETGKIVHVADSGLILNISKKLF